MPRALELKLKREARRRHYSKRRTGAFVYGTLRRMGWRPGLRRRHLHRRR